MSVVDAKTKLVELIARNAGNSKSPAMYNASFEYFGLNNIFLAFDVAPSELESAIHAIRSLNLLGANIATPYKQSVIKYLDHLDQSADLIGNVNTIVNRCGTLTGYTTEGLGFIAELIHANVSPINKKMTLVGMGGAGSSIVAQSALAGMKEISVFNRDDASGQNARQTVAKINAATDCQVTFFDLDDRVKLKAEIKTADIFVDATNLGAGKLVNMSIIDDATWLHQNMAVVDTVYTPVETKLLRLAGQAGVRHILTGLGLLVQQGAVAFKLWTGKEMPVDFVKQRVF